MLDIPFFALPSEDHLFELERRDLLFLQLGDHIEKGSQQSYDQSSLSFIRSVLLDFVDQYLYFWPDRFEESIPPRSSLPYLSSSSRHVCSADALIMARLCHYVIVKRFCGKATVHLPRQTPGGHHALLSSELRQWPLSRWRDGVTSCSDSGSTP